MPQDLTAPPMATTQAPSTGTASQRAAAPDTAPVTAPPAAFQPPATERNRRILHLAADMACAPWYICLRRACRRKRHCSTWDSEIGCPACVANMVEEERDLFARLAGMAAGFDDLLKSRPLASWRPDEPDTERGMLQRDALEIVDMLARGDPRRLAEFRDFWRREAKMRVPCRNDTHSGNGTDISAPAHLSSST